MDEATLKREDAGVSLNIAMHWRVDQFRAAALHTFFQFLRNIIICARSHRVMFRVWCLSYFHAHTYIWSYLFQFVLAAAQLSDLLCRYLKTE